MVQSAEGGAGVPVTRTWRVAKALGPWAALAVPVAGYFAFIAAYGVNTIVLDQWTDVALLQKLYRGHLTLSALWAAHNENRMLVPNLVMLALARLTHLDTVVEMDVSAVAMAGAVAALVAAHRRRAPATPLWRYVPVAALVFTLAQYAGALLGFELSWYLCLLALCVALYLLDAPALRVAGFTGAVVVGVLGSFSGYEGLLVWPAGLLLLVARRRPLPMLGAWVAAGAVTTVVYFVGLSLGSGTVTRYGLDHPATGVRFFLLALGDVLGFHLAGGTTGGAGEALLMAFGALVLLAGVATGAAAFSPRLRDGPAPLGAALVLAGLLFTASIAVGRAFWGVAVASESRYVTFDLLPFVGIYLVAISWARSPLGAVPAERTWLRSAAPAVVCTVVAALVGVGAVNGVRGGRSMLAAARAASDVTVNIAHVPDPAVEDVLYPLVPAAYMRSLAPVARQHQLSLFDTSQVAAYQQDGLRSCAAARDELLQILSLPPGAETVAGC